MLRLPAPLVLTASLVLLNCGSDRVAGGAGVGNPPVASVAISVRAANAPPLALAKRAAASPTGDTLSARDSSGVVFRMVSISARLQLMAIELPEDKSCNQVRGDVDCRDSALVLTGPYIMDLAAGTSVPELKPIRIPAWTYPGVEMEIQEGTAGGDSANFTVTGTFGDTASGMKRFALDLDLDEGLEFPNAAALAIKADTLNQLVLRLGVDGWFAGVDLAACLVQAGPDSTGVYRLEGNDFCSGAGRRIGANIARSGEFDDGDSDRNEESEH